MVLDVALTLNLKIEVDDEMVKHLNVDGYDLAVMLAGMYGDEMLKAKRDDHSYHSRIAVKSWKID